MQEEELKVTYRLIEDIHDAARNARTHSDAQIEQLCKIIAEFGFTTPVLVDEHGVLIAGHGRLRAARKLAMAKVPTITLSGLTDAQKRALAIADNRIALSAGWDAEVLRFELDALSRIEEVDIANLGFSQKELSRLIGGQQDATPAMQGGLEYRLIVDVDSEEQQAQLLERLEAEGFKCRPLIS